MTKEVSLILIDIINIQFPQYMQDKASRKDALLNDGISAALNWFRVVTSGLSAEDDICTCYLLIMSSNPV